MVPKRLPASRTGSGNQFRHSRMGGTSRSKSPSPKKKSTDLEKQSWYHGMRPRKECEALLNEKGDWLVRATDNDNEGRLSVVLTVLDQKRVAKHLIITKNEKNRFILSALKEKDRVQFDTVAELIAYYQKKGGIGAIKMGSPKNRPTWMIKHEQVTFDENKDKLGSGNYCVVYKGIYKEEQRVTNVAVKVCLQLDEERKPDQITAERQSMLREAELLASYAHENVIQLYGVAADHPPVQIVLEYCPGGSLDKHLQEYRDKIETAERLLYMKDAARGMSYLHEKGCIHRDIASRNCLIAESGLIKIADFGLSKLIAKTEKEADPETGMGFPVRWMAPESLQKKREYSTKSDVWSYGVMVYETFNNGNKPWPDWETKKIATHIRKGRMPELPDTIPSELRDYLKTKIWNVDPEKRVDMDAVCKKVEEASRVVGRPLRPVIKRQTKGGSKDKGTRNQESTSSVAVRLSATRRHLLTSTLKEAQRLLLARALAQKLPARQFYAKRLRSTNKHSCPLYY
ncbi:unnamed protein product, partial [Mesorhabditis spiculigera]